jgi:hypothetical protein
MSNFLEFGDGKEIQFTFTVNYYFPSFDWEVGR